MGKEKELEEFRKYIQDGLKVFKGLGNDLENLSYNDTYFLAYLSYHLLKHSKRLGWLTIALIILTLVLAVLAASNIWLLL